MQSAELAQHAQRAGTVAHWLVWVSARNRDTGAIEATGFWTGGDDLAFTIGGVSRPYIGAGSLLDVPPIPEETGLNVRMLTVGLTVDEATKNLVRGYDPGLQPVEIHRAVFNPETMALVAEPEFVFAGTVDETPIETGPIGGSSKISLVIASLTRGLTRTVPLMKSDAALKERASGDLFRQYTAVTSKWQVPWGQGEVTAPASRPSI